MVAIKDWKMEGMHLPRWWIPAILLLFHAVALRLRSASAELDYCTDKSHDDICSSLKIGTGLSSTVRLNDGMPMPLFGLGLYQAETGSVAEDATIFALRNGYRLLDTAQIYGNEADVGRAVRNSGIAREDIFVVSKVFTTNHGYSRTVESVNASLERLQMDYVDLFLIHSPYGGYNVETYQALLDLKAKGFIRSVGVSNFEIQHLEGLKEAGLPTPAVNQIELHPFQRRDRLVHYCQDHDIAIMGYSPLARTYKLNDPDVLDLANKYQKTPAQIMIRWSVQKGYITIPKSTRSERILENANVFDFSLTYEDMKILDNTDQFTCGWDTSEYVWDG